MAVDFASKQRAERGRVGSQSHKVGNVEEADLCVLGF